MAIFNFTEREIKIIIDNLENGAFFNQKSVKKIVEKLRKPHKRITVASAKAKGRNLQNWAVEKIAALLGEILSKNKDENNIRGREMGQSGVDVWLHKSIVDKFPIAVECKCQEQLQLIQFIEQAKNNTTNKMPYWLLILKNKKIKNPVCVMEWELFESLYKKDKKGTFGFVHNGCI